MSIELIQPAEVQRDENGYWFHPELPNFDEGQDEAWLKWMRDQGLRIKVVDMQYDLDDPDAHPYFAEDACHCLNWEPTPPKGEGWFCLVIADTEDGPCCWWARRINQTQEAAA